MKKKFREALKNYWEVIFFGILGFLTRFFYLSYPSRVVFDEAHFGLYATKYLSRQYYFDIHPPLGKMLLALAAILGKIKPGFQFEEGSAYGDFNFLVLRLVPALFGALLILLIYFFLKEIGLSRRVAFLASFFVLFDNAFLTQSRLILLDIILIFFIFLGLYLFTLLKKFSPFSFKWYLFHLLCGLALGAAISIKWTGFGALAIILFLLIFDHIFSKSKREIFTRLAFLVFVPLFIYLFIFFLHFSILNSVCLTDCGWVLERSLIEKGKTVPFQGNLFAKIIYDNFLSFSQLSSYTPFYYASDWWSWPFLIRPILYFAAKYPDVPSSGMEPQKNSPEGILRPSVARVVHFKEAPGDKTSFIYFIGNPIVWWLALGGTVGFFYLKIKESFPRFKFPKNYLSPICGYVFYFLPFFFIKRVMLIYHYLPALIFSIILAALFFELVMEKIFGPSFKDNFLFQNKKANFLFFGILVIAFFGFLFFSPLTYGLPLTDSDYQGRMWLDTWRLIDY